MNDKELKENIDKITEILYSSKYEAGFELLITKNDPELNEAMVDIITEVVTATYFYKISDQKLIDNGLEIMCVLFPLLSSLDLSNSFMKNLDISKFTNLKVLNLEGCDCLENIDGIYTLNNLTNLNLKYTSSLKSLNISKLNHIDEIVGLRDLQGMVILENDLHSWFSYLDDYLYEFEENLEEYLGGSIDLVIDESDFYNGEFSSVRSIRYTLDRYLSKEQIDNLPTTDDDEVAVFLFHNGWDFIASFHKHKDDFPE